MEQQKQKLASEPNQNYRKKWNFKNLQTLRSPLLQLQKKKTKIYTKVLQHGTTKPQKNLLQNQIKI